MFLIFAEVLKAERDASRKIYDQEREKIRETIAFQRRSEGPPNIYYPGKEQNLTKFGKCTFLIICSKAGSFMKHLIIQNHTIFFKYLKCNWSL